MILLLLLGITLPLFAMEQVGNNGAIATPIYMVQPFYDEYGVASFYDEYGVASFYDAQGHLWKYDVDLGTYVLSSMSSSDYGQNPITSEFQDSDIRAPINPDEDLDVFFKEFDQKVHNDEQEAIRFLQTKNNWFFKRYNDLSCNASAIARLGEGICKRSDAMSSEDNRKVTLEAAYVYLRCAILSGNLPQKQKHDVRVLIGKRIRPIIFPNAGKKKESTRKEVVLPCTSIVHVSDGKQEEIPVEVVTDDSIVLDHEDLLEHSPL